MIRTCDRGNHCHARASRLTVVTAIAVSYGLWKVSTRDSERRWAATRPARGGLSVRPPVRVRACDSEVAQVIVCGPPPNLADGGVRRQREYIESTLKMKQ